MEAQAEKTNRLINEKSPYLLQHAHNPVDWYPWGDEAFDKAKAENKPIFLSIGYSTCHWCHVMEKESFEDEEVAQKLNEGFVCIKVDREERPDIDSVYMDFCQKVTGSGGWPLTVFLDSKDRKPFYVGTYYPKDSKYGRVGIMDVLDDISNAWEKRRDDVRKSIQFMMNEIKKLDIENNTADSSETMIANTYKLLNNSFDSAYGGFGYAPKFPTPSNIFFLLRYYVTYKDKKALEMVTKTLDGMYYGGIFDHIGFGFSRYSTDEKWLVPHFEKMLYDNALLAIAYTEAYRATDDEKYKKIAEKVIGYVLRDMLSEEGGFCSAEDADSEGVEGKFYLFEKQEIINILGKDEGEEFSNAYNITESGNFEGKNILNIIHKNIDEELERKLALSREKVYEYRKNRVHPFKDDKVLVSWNGLMIATLSYAGRALHNEQYIGVAERALEFIMNKMIDEKGRLYTRYREGCMANFAVLEDYSSLIWGLIETYESTFKPYYLEKAIQFTYEMFDKFWDIEEGGFYLYGKDSEQLFERPKEIYDGAIPSGNSIAAMNLVRLTSLTGNIDFKSKLDILFKTFSKTVSQSPNYYAYFMSALLYANTNEIGIVIAGKKESESTNKFLELLDRKYLPFVTIILNDGNEDIQKLVPFTKDQEVKDDQALVYACKDGACGLPISETDSFAKILGDK